DGALHLRLAPGVHQVKLAGPIAAMTLAFGTVPHEVAVEAEGFLVEGVEDGRVSGPVRISPVGADQPQEPPLGPDVPPGTADLEVPPWLVVTRTFDIGVRWTVETRLVRASRLGAPILVRFPLATGERVLTEGVTQEGREAVVTLGRTTKEATFQTALEPRAALERVAPTDRPWNETWVLRCGVVWRCDATGLAPFEHMRDGVYRPSFKPWPGEKVTLGFERPAPAPGRATTVHRATLELTIGPRTDEATLSVAIQTSTGGIESLALPADAHLTKLTVDGQAQAASLDGGELRVSLPPGPHALRVEWEAPGGQAWNRTTPSVRVGDRAYNATVLVRWRGDRVILATFGAGWGPSVRFWGLLGLCAAVALGLALSRKSALALWQWMLLAVGMAFVSPLPALFIAAWPFVLAHRERRAALPPLSHNLGQVALVVSTLLAAGALALAVSHAVGDPELWVAGALAEDGRRPEGTLLWYAAATDGTLPVGRIVSVPLGAWQAGAAVWALGLAFALVVALRRGYRAFRQGGLWLAPPAPAPAPAPAAAPTGEPPATAAPVPEAPGPAAPPPAKDSGAEAGAADDAESEDDGRP
ncbi:MAG: hypothetical protein IT373_11745, partial [Polyangiaceae bacterium]|nr:hypothetical protein [Polyangiaceae bacterium]